MFYPLLKTPAVGETLAPLIKMISQEKMDRYCEVTGNGGVIHLDTAYCKEHYSHGKTYAPGQMVLAYISELMEQNFGLAWFTGGVMDVKFIGAAHPGDTVVVSGEIKEIVLLDKGMQAVCSCTVTRQDDSKAAVADCSVILKG